MGLYVWVSKYCCNEELQFQSKSGPDEYAEYSVDSVPIDVARDIDGEVQECPHCLRRYKIQRRPQSYETVSMEITCENEDEIGEEEEEKSSSLEERLARLEKEMGLKK